MAGKKDIVEQALKLIAGGAKEAAPTVAERTAKNLDVFNTAKRLGEDTNDLAKLQETKRLMEFHKGFTGDVKERAKSLAEAVQQMKEAGAFPMEVGTRYTTEHSRRTGQSPWTITNYYVDPKNPQGSYGYYVRRELPDGGYEESVSKIRDPKLEALHGPEKWEELQRGITPMTGPKVVKQAGGRTGYGPGGVIDDIVKMAGKIVSGADEPAKTGIRAYHGTPQPTENLIDLFHGTTPEAFDAITSSGNIFGSSRFSPRRDVAETFAYNVGGDDNTVVKVKAPASSLMIDLDLPNAKLLTPDQAAAYLDKPDWTILDFIENGYSVGVPDTSVLSIDRAAGGRTGFYGNNSISGALNVARGMNGGK
jgi:hypothetical protein